MFFSIGAGNRFHWICTHPVTCFPLQEVRPPTRPLAVLAIKRFNTCSFPFSPFHPCFSALEQETGFFEYVHILRPVSSPGCQSPYTSSCCLGDKTFQYLLLSLLSSKQKCFIDFESQHVSAFTLGHRCSWNEKLFGLKGKHKEVKLSHLLFIYPCLFCERTSVTSWREKVFPEINMIV